MKLYKINMNWFVVRVNRVDDDLANHEYFYRMQIKVSFQQTNFTLAISAQ